MAVANLTERILYLVFSKYYILQNRGSLTPYTAILSVSSSWRRAAIRAISECLWLSYSEDGSSSITNIGLIAGLNSLHLVKQLYIEASTYEYGIGLVPAVELLQAYYRVWPSIQTLSIDCGIIQGYQSIREGNRMWANSKDSIRRLYNLLPNVTKLHLHGTGMQHKRQLSEIAKRYWNKATSLECSHPTIVAGQNHFKQLKHLQLAFLRQASFPLDLEVANLTSLVLKNLPRTFSWKCLAKNSKDRVVLPCLKLLEVDGLVDSLITRRKKALDFQLHFPELQQLKLVPHDGTYFVLTNGVFGKPLQHLELHGTCNTLSSLCQTTMPQTDSLSLTIALTDDMLAQAMDVTSILAKYALSVQVKFELCNISLVEFPAVHFAALTHIHIPSKIEMQQVVNALRYFPNLVEFDYKVRVKWQSLHNSVDWDEPVHSLNSSLRTLTMRCSEYLVDCMDTAIRFMKYLLLRLPNLDTVILTTIPVDEMVEFARANQAAYSHLANIKFSSAG